jgi:RNA polymerase sigma-70 factor (ECF subfamily)
VKKEDAVQVIGLAAAAPWRRVLDEARAALRRYRLSEADREDVAQCAALTAYRKWHTYRAGAGTVRQWVRGIVRHEVWHLWRSRRRDEKAESFVDLAGEGDTPEMVALRRVVAQRLLAGLPEARRRAVMLVELEGRTLAEAAAVEASSITRMHARYHAGMGALRARVMLGEDAGGPGAS